jgi:hypothetical protein
MTITRKLRTQYSRISLCKSAITAHIITLYVLFVEVVVVFSNYDLNCRQLYCSRGGRCARVLYLCR